MKKGLAIIQILFLIVIFSIFISNNQDYSATLRAEGILDPVIEDFKVEQVLDKETFLSAIQTPKQYKNESVAFGAQLKHDPIYNEEKNIYTIHVWQDPIHRVNSVVIQTHVDPGLKAYDYVLVTGVTRGQGYVYNSRNLPVKGLLVEANTLVKASYADAVAPAITVIDVNKTVKQYGVNITVKSIEFSEVDTRVNVVIENSTKDNFNFFTFKTGLKINNKTYRQVEHWHAQYDPVETYLGKRANDSGVLVFPAIGDHNERELRLVIKGRVYKGKHNATFEWKLTTPAAPVIEVAPEETPEA